jgi:hypothetical protein
MKKNENKIWLPREEYINQLAAKTNEVSISCVNSKTGPLCNDLALPTCTCREDAPCKATGCYCMKGRQTMSKVVAAYTRNLRLYNTDQEDFWEQVRFKVKHRPFPLFRFFDCGDIADYDFFLGMIDLAKEFPDIKFMSFTKKYEIVNKWIDENGDLPENLNVVFSAWHIGWKVINPHNLPVAYVDFKDKTLNPEFPEGITSCPNEKDKTITCSICRKCWDKRIKAVKFTQH